MAPIVAVIDGDGQHDERLLPRLFAIVRDGSADVAIGSRYCAEGSTGGWDARRLRASRAATRLSRLVLQSPVADPMSGFFAVRRDRVEAMLPRLSGRGFKILFDLLTSSPEPLRAVEIPFEFRLRTAGESKLGTGVAVDYLVTVADRLLRRHLPSRFVMFSAVGSFGVAVNLIACMLLMLAGLPQERALLASTVLAFLTNFHLDNVVTFRDRRLHGWRLLRGMALYAAICGLGALAGTSIGAMIYSGIHRPLRNAVAGAVIGVLWNFVGASKVVWRRRR